MKKLFFAVLLCGLLMISSGAAAAEEAYWITIDPIPDQMLGTTYTISGATNLPAGSELLFEHMREHNIHDTRGYGLISEMVTVQKGTTEGNTWSIMINSSQFSYTGKSLVRIHSIHASIWRDTTYNLIDPTPEEAYWITIDPIPDQMIGTTYTISGETNLPAGSNLLFGHYWADWECHDTRVCCKPTDSGEITYVTQVHQGDGDTNVWNAVMNTSGFGYAREFLVKISSLDTPAWNWITYNLLEPTPETPWVILDPIPDQHRGTPVTITGSVFQPQEGRLLITIQPVWFITPPLPTPQNPFPS